MGFYEGFLEICGQNWSITMLLVKNFYVESHLESDSDELGKQY